MFVLPEHEEGNMKARTAVKLLLLLGLALALTGGAFPEQPVTRPSLAAVTVNTTATCWSGTVRVQNANGVNGSYEVSIDGTVIDSGTRTGNLTLNYLWIDYPSLDICTQHTLSASVYGLSDSATFGGSTCCLSADCYTWATTVTDNQDGTWTYQWCATRVGPTPACKNISRVEVVTCAGLSESDANQSCASATLPYPPTGVVSAYVRAAGGAVVGPYALAGPDCHYVQCSQTSIGELITEGQWYWDDLTGQLCRDDLYQLYDKYFPAQTCGTATQTVCQEYTRCTETVSGEPAPDGDWYWDEQQGMLCRAIVYPLYDKYDPTYQCGTEPGTECVQYTRCTETVQGEPIPMGDWYWDENLGQLCRPVEYPLYDKYDRSYQCGTEKGTQCEPYTPCLEENQVTHDEDPYYVGAWEYGQNMRCRELRYHLYDRYTGETCDGYISDEECENYTPLPVMMTCIVEPVCTEGYFLLYGLLSNDGAVDVTADLVLYLDGVEAGRFSYTVPPGGKDFGLSIPVSTQEYRVEFGEASCGGTVPCCENENVTLLCGPAVCTAEGTLLPVQLCNRCANPVNHYLQVVLNDEATVYSLSLELLPGECRDLDFALPSGARTYGVHYGYLECYGELPVCASPTTTRTPTPTRMPTLTPTPPPFRTPVRTPTATPTLPLPALVVCPSCVPDIAFQSKRDGNWEIYRVDMDTLAETRLTEDPADDTAPSMYPAGTHVAFQTNRDGNWEIYGMDAFGGNPTNLSRNESSDEAPSWSCEYIHFQSDRDGNWEIYRMHADGSEQTRLTFDAAEDEQPSASSMQRVAFQSRRDGNWEIYSMRADGSDLRRLTHTAWDEVSPSWSPDGSEIAFQSKRWGTWQLALMNADGSNVRYLTHGGNDLAESPEWFPLCDWIAFQGWHYGDWDVYRITPDGRVAQRMVYDPRSQDLLNDGAVGY